MTKGLGKGFSVQDTSVPLQESRELIPWRDAMALGIPEIDRQHRDLLARVNALADALLDPHGQAIRLARLEDLLAATHRHFDWEEALMAAHGYPRLTPHHEQHSELLGAIERLRDDLQRRGHTVNRPGALRFLADWFQMHLTHSDADLVASLRGNARPANGKPDDGRKENGHPQVAV